MNEDRVTIDSLYVWEGPPRLELERKTVTRATGETWEGHRLVVQRGLPGVVIIAGDERSILFVRHDRPGADGQFLELPRGFGEALPHDFSSADAAACHDAARELREETGYVAAASRVAGWYVTDSSLLPGRIAAVQVDVDAAAVPGETDDEVRDCVWIDRSTVGGLIAGGEIRDAHTLSALVLAHILD